MRRQFEAEGIGFLAISLEPREPLVRDAVQRLGIRVPVAIARGELLGPLGVRAVPSTLFVSSDGTIVAVASGYRSERFLRARTEELLATTRTAGAAPRPRPGR